MNVLLGIGGSEDSLRALEFAVERAAAAGDDLTVAVVENPDSDMAPAAVAERAREAVTDAGLDADVRPLEGDPGSRLVELAEGGEFDQLVLGGGERSPMGKIQLGSITEFVLLNSHVTVTLVR
jgi:nucleotide-binding universal stress UspA family protein